MNLKLYKQFCGAYQQCVQAALEDSHIQGDVTIVAKGLPTEGITMLFEKKERYGPVISMREAFLRMEMLNMWEEELVDRAIEVFSDSQTADLKIAVSQLEQPENVAIYAANHRLDLDALKNNDMPYLVMGNVVFYYMFYAPLGDGRYYQAEVTNRHLKNWNMRKGELHSFVREHSLVSMESRIYPLHNMIENMLDGIPCVLNDGEAEDTLGYTVTGPGGAATILYWDVLRELQQLMHDSFYILPYTEREAYILPDTMAALTPGFSIEEIHRNGNHQVRRSLSGYAVSSHGFHYSPSDNKLLTIREWEKVMRE